MMILATALYWIAIGLVCFAGSALVAGVLRRRGHQERGVWAAGLAAALVLPLVLPMTVGPAASASVAGGPVGPIPVLDLAPLQVGVVEASTPGWLPPVLLAVWAALSALLLLRSAAAVRTVSRVRRSAKPAATFGEFVRVTREQGPAVAGFLRPIILIPEWVLDLPRERRGWIIRHEEEHIRGRDPWLLGFVLTARIAVPWNPLVWLFGRSIRAAIETDCDRRTVEPGGDLHAYSEALLTIAGGRGGRGALSAMAPAFAERGVPLDHRIETLTTPRRRIGTGLRLALGSVAVLVVGAACEMPAPTESERPDAAPVLRDLDLQEASVAGDTSDGPRFTPYDVPPRLVNPGEVQQTLDQEYPPLLKESGIGGEVVLWLHLSDEGEVLDARVREEPSGSSGYDALDAAALAAADAMRFEPAMNRDEATAVWVQIPITFTAGGETGYSDRPVVDREGGDVPARPTDEAAPEFEDRPVGAAGGYDEGQYTAQDPDQPRFIPYDTPPHMTNAPAVERLLEREYPPVLKEAGIGGEVTVWLHISDTGEVLDTQIRTDPPGTSGHDGLDAAALRVADAMEFEPAMNQEKRTDVWVQIPITFTVGN